MISPLINSSGNKIIDKFHSEIGKEENLNVRIPTPNVKNKSRYERDDEPT